MINYLILLISLIFIWLVDYSVNKKDLLRPASIITIMFVFSTVLSIIGKSTWNNIGDLSIKSVVFLLSSIISLAAGSKFADKYSFKIKNNISYRSYDKNNIYKQAEYVIDERLNRLLLIISLIIFVAYLYAIRIAYGTNDFLKIMALGHSTFFYNDVIANRAYFSIATNILKLLKSITYAYVIMFCYEVVFNKGKKYKKLYLLLPTILFAICQLIRGTRHGVILLIISVLLTLYLMLNKKQSGVIRSLNRKYLLFGALLVALILYLFIQLAPLLGQYMWGNNEAYISYYFGASIPSMDVALQDPIRANITTSKIWGYHIFAGFYDTLNSIGITNITLPKEIGWFAFAMNYKSNIFSAPLVMYIDFGVIGAIVLSFAEGFIYNKIYQKAKKPYSQSSLSLIMLVYLYPSVFNWYRTEDLISQDLSSITTYVSILITFMIFKLKFKSRKRIRVKVNRRSGCL